MKKRQNFNDVMKLSSDILFDLQDSIDLCVAAKHEIEIARETLNRSLANIRDTHFQPQGESHDG